MLYILTKFHRIGIWKNETRSVHNKKLANGHLNQILTQMSRNRPHIAESQRQRLKIKEKLSKFIPGTVTLQILGSGAPGAPSSIYLFTDQSRYLFNCGEGTQRLAHEHKTKLARLEHIFFTRTSWDHLGGLPGLSLTVQDTGVPRLHLHGPPGLDEIFSGMKKFVVLKHLKVEAINHENGGIYEDQVMTVFCVPLRKKFCNLTEDSENSTTDIDIDDTDYYAYENSSSGSSSPETFNGFSTEKREETVVISYICKLKPRPGTLNLEKCVEKGVPAGPLLGQLKNGTDIVLADGTLVRADDVRSGEDPGAVFIFLDIPNEEYLCSFGESENIFKKYQISSKDEKNIASVIVHFSPQNIIETSIYQQFMNRFPLSTKHLIVNATNNFSGYVAAHKLQFQLNQISESIFPILRENTNTVKSSNDFSPHKRMKVSAVNNSTNNYLPSPSISNDFNLLTDSVVSLTSYHLRPKKGFDRSLEPVIDPNEYIEEAYSIEGFNESLNSLKETLSKKTKRKSKYEKCMFPRILFLGTGSCIPNKTRNVSAVLLHINSDNCMLFDCGEGTWGQIIRFYGIEKASEILRNLKVIFISHLHADHHIGLLGIIKARKSILNENSTPLLLFAPKQITSWLQFYHQRFETIQEQYILQSINEISELKNMELRKIGIEKIAFCPVRHCPHAFGVALETNLTRHENFKLTYSGDTMPCETLVEIGKNSTVLIHEATMEDELINQAKYKMHSTVSQAIEQGRKMNAKFILLTHFSQRYAKIPRLQNNLELNVGIAFDNMEVNLADLHYLHELYPTMKILFTEHFEEMELKAFKRAMKKERQKLVLNEFNK